MRMMFEVRDDSEETQALLELNEAEVADLLAQLPLGWSIELLD